MPTAHGGWTLGRVLGVAVPLAIVAAVVRAQLWHGPTLLTLSAVHGVDTGDLIAVPFLLLSIGMARRRPPRVRSPDWALTATAVALGMLLLLTGMLTGQGGPLVPAGGATLDGEIAQTMAPDAVEVGRWTRVALTYDGAAERLYVDGHEVARHAASGRIQAPGTPLWIGGNRPYGEHFAGVIDEVRAFDRALSAAEIRRDLERPVAPERGLVAGYGFDEGSGRTAVDASGRRNAGTISGATWARGRYGSGLRFDGASSVVRVAPSASLDLGGAMTLSAWIRPSAQQHGWRAIVQREADAYFLSAGSSRLNYSGPVDATRTIAVVVTGGLLALLIGAARAPRTALRRRTWWLPLVLFTLGSLADAAISPTVTLMGPLLVALWLATTATGRTGRACLGAVAGGLAGVTLASLGGLGEVGDALIRLHGSTARSLALGALFVVAGVLARPSELPARTTAG